MNAGVEVEECHLRQSLVGVVVDYGGDCDCDVVEVEIEVEEVKGRADPPEKAGDSE